MARDRRVPCRVCGKLFIPCNKSSDMIGAFNYREVCCSPECGQQYLHDVMVARGLLKKKEEKPEIVQDNKEETEDTGKTGFQLFHKKEGK